MPPSATAQTVTPVLNNREAVIQCQLPGKTNKSGQVTHGPLLVLMPGMNFPETDKWLKAKENPTLAQMLIDKIEPSRKPEENPEKFGCVILEEQAPVSKDNPLSAMSDSAAIITVGELFDVPTMKRFLEQETRPGVAAALKGQINKIEKPQAQAKK